MSATSNSKNKQHIVYLSIGSNIQAEKKIPEAIKALGNQCQLLKISSFWKGPAVGSVAPDFLNASVKLTTSLAAEELKKQVLGVIETQMGRVRNRNKFAPRPIDLDIAIYDDELMDEELWRFAHLALPLAEIYPDFRNSDTGESLEEVASRLGRESEIRKVATSTHL